MSIESVQRNSTDVQRVPKRTHARKLSKVWSPYDWNTPKTERQYYLLNYIQLCYIHKIYWVIGPNLLQIQLCGVTKSSNIFKEGIKIHQKKRNICKRNLCSLCHHHTEGQMPSYCPNNISVLLYNITLVLHRQLLILYIIPIILPCIEIARWKRVGSGSRWSKKGQIF